MEPRTPSEPLVREGEATPSRAVSARKWRSVLLILANLIVTALLAWFGSSFEPVDSVLSRCTWEAGTPSSTYITAFATAGPWWLRHEPEAIRVTPSGGVEHVVRVPRSHVVVTREPVLPSRSVGYYSILGAITALRSGLSSHLIYDLEIIVVFQRALLLVSIAAVALALFMAHGAFRKVHVLLAFNLAYLPVLALWPNRRKFIPDGIVDSALANALALLGVVAFLVVLKSSALRNRRSVVLLVSSAMFLSFCSLVRGEFFLINAFVYLFLIVMSLRRRERWRGIAVACLLLLVFPVANGLVNKAVFGHFVPLRMQSGQNLFEPIGQYPNPWGIQYNDAWMTDYLDERGYDYFSFETDAFLTRQYAAAVSESPGLFFSNLTRRLDYFSRELAVRLDIWTLPIVLLLAGLLAARDERFLPIAVPLVMAVGYLLFFGWFNRLLRLVTPVHFLLNTFVCYAAVYTAVALARAREQRNARRETPGLETVPSTIA